MNSATYNSLQNFSQIHITNLVKTALEKQKVMNSNEFVIGQKVDNANRFQKNNADPNPHEGYTLPKK